jgi:predicted ATPase
VLDAQERTVLDRLGVFAGGFTLTAASAVASDQTIDEFTVVDRLSHLVAGRSSSPKRAQRETATGCSRRRGSYAREKLGRYRGREQAGSAGTRATTAIGGPVPRTIG